MKNLTHDQIIALYNKLPDDLRAAISSVESTKAIQEIGKKHGLLIDKMGALAGETSYVLIGAEHIKDYVSNLSQALGVDMMIAQKIAADVNEQIFAKVRESLKKLHTEGTSPGSAEKTESREASQPPISPAPSAATSVGQVATPAVSSSFPAAETPPNLPVQPAAPVHIDATETGDTKTESAKPTMTWPTGPVGQPRSPFSPQETRDELLREIEKEENLPEIFGGVNIPNGEKASIPKPVNPFEAKMGGVFQAPPAEVKPASGPASTTEKPAEQKPDGYKGTDPYREPIE